jgi:hypothetical protein
MLSDHKLIAHCPRTASPGGELDVAVVLDVSTDVPQLGCLVADLKVVGCAASDQVRVGLQLTVLKSAEKVMVAGRNDAINSTCSESILRSRAESLFNTIGLFTRNGSHLRD